MIMDGSVLANGESAPYAPFNRSAGGSGSGFMDLYSGAAFTQDAAVSVREFAPFFNPPASVRQTVDFDAPDTFGARIGHWFEGAPQLGLALDVSFFRAAGKGVDIDLFPVSELLMIRWGMRRSTDFPKGRLQPYVGIGPGIFVIPNVEVDFRPAVTDRVSGESIEVGLDARAGLAWQLHKRFAIFAEYRFTYVNIDLKKRGCVSLACAFSIFGSEGTSSEAEATLDTHDLLLGMSFPF